MNLGCDDVLASIREKVRRAQPGALLTATAQPVNLRPLSNACGRGGFRAKLRSRFRPKGELREISRQKFEYAKERAAERRHGSQRRFN
jgi:hypothetical protein